MALLTSCVSCISVPIDAEVQTAAHPVKRKKPVLINGVLANPVEWPASVWTRSCSATVVGERSVILAAHCMDDGGSISFQVGPHYYTAKCTHAPGYKNEISDDWAYCLTDRSVVGIKYETVGTSKSAVGKEVTLTGYGCTDSQGLGGNDGSFRVGVSRVTKNPSVEARSSYLTTYGDGALCYGDSGGGAYSFVAGSRYLIGINSRGNIEDSSSLSATHHNRHIEFALAWSAKNKTKICGIHKDAVNCRSPALQSCKENK